MKIKELKEKLEKFDDDWDINMHWEGAPCNCIIRGIIYSTYNKKRSRKIATIICS